MSVIQINLSHLIIVIFGISGQRRIIDNHFRFVEKFRFLFQFPFPESVICKGKKITKTYNCENIADSCAEYRNQAHISIQN